MITSNYLANLNNSLEDLTKINEKVSQGRSYLKASEDPAAALKAFQVRQNLTRISLYQDNVSQAGDILTDVESAISELNSVLTSVSEQVIKGKSDTCSTEDRLIIAEVLRNYQAEVLDVANYKSANKYIFGGSDMTEAPFTVTGGTLNYHGIDVNTNGVFGEEKVFFDIGLGLATDASGNVVEGSAFNVANPGSGVFGTGIDANGIPNNIYNLLGEISDQFESNDLTNMDSYMEKLESVRDGVIIQYVNVGQKTNFLGFLSERLESNDFNAQTKQSNIENIDAAAGILDYNTQKVAYEAALAMGGKIIQYSLLDYMS